MALIIEISTEKFHSRKIINAVTETCIYPNLHGMGRITEE
jgi:hypothetical protein